MTSYELIDYDEFKLLKFLIDKDKWDDVVSDYGSEIAIQLELGFTPQEMEQWKEVWLEDW